MWVYSHTSSSIWCVSVLGKCFIQMAYSRLSQQWAPGVAFSPYQARSARLWFDICVFVRVYVCACVCVFASMCPIFVSCLLDSPQTRLTDIIYMHTESFSKHTHTHTHADCKTNGPCWHTDRDVDKLLFRLNAQPNRKPQLHLSLSVWLQQR